MKAQQALRAEICRVGRSLFERGYVHATAGNISVRLSPEQGGGTLITPTDACLGFLQPDALAWVGDDGQQHSGERASKTLALHRRIYAADPAAGCIIHTHSTHLVALSLLRGARQRPVHNAPSSAPTSASASAPTSFPPAALSASDDLLPPITPYFVMKVGHVPLIPYHRPGDPAVAERVTARMQKAREAGTPLRAVMLDRLGPNVWHQTPAQAMAVLEELEETARLWVMVQGGAQPIEPLNAAQLEELRQQFGAAW